MDARAEAEEFEHQRGYLFSIAYRLLGSVGDAEDMVQNTYLHWARESRTDIESPRAYLATIIVRLCLDELRSARAKREVYVGPWLPEPLITSGRDDLTETVAMRESLSFAFLLVLEALSPLERAVFVLREVFDYDYVDIARTVDKSIVYCRQVFHRARQHLADRQSGFETSREQQQAITEQFLHAMANGNVQEAIALLAEDVVAIGDGGGRANAALQPVYGVGDVARALQANLPNWPLAQARLLDVNGEPAICRNSRRQALRHAAARIHRRPRAATLCRRQPRQVEGPGAHLTKCGAEDPASSATTPQTQTSKEQLTSGHAHRRGGSRLTLYRASLA